jgi:plasmid rolling circle replication initiator protein Rep
MANLTSSSQVDKALSDLSPRDKPWDIHKRQSIAVSRLYSELNEQRYSERVLDCSKWLEFALVASDQGEINLKLFASRFCRFRHCPICQWRRSLMWVARLAQVLPKLLQDYPSVHFVFLTLTVRNCEVDHLRETIAKMNKAWNKFVQRKAFPALGFLKSVEVTRGQDGSAHPHFTGRLYLSQAKWSELWAKSLRVDYNPVVNVKKIKVNSDNLLTGLIDAVRETCKYSVKPADLVKDVEWLGKLTTELHKTRAVSVGGILRNYLSEYEPEDLVSEVNPDNSDQVLETLVFGWHEIVSHYLLTG